MTRFYWGVVICLMSAPVLAEPGLNALSVTTGPDGEQTYSVTLQLLALMTALTLLPAALIMMTAFTRIIVVLAILRQALGTAQTPSSQVLMGLALFLTLFVMTPVLERINEEALQPYLNEDMEFQQAVKRAAQPLSHFMLQHTRESDLALFARIAGKEQTLASPDDVSFALIMPAFVISELKTAFEIGFVIFIPFLIIDLVVASVLMSMGMMMLSPLIISFPFKIMLFVLVDGWALVVGTLASSFVI
jgi:flagellar biosynthetic protein FliP